MFRKHALLLARAFFRRFFENDILPRGLPQVQLVLWSVTALSMPGYLLSFFFWLKYTLLVRHPARLADAMLADEFLLVALSMLALAPVTLMSWEGAFPDRRDARLLGLLPLSRRTHVTGRLAAIALFTGIFCIGVNTPAAVVYGLVMASYGGAAWSLRAIGAHLIVTGMAGMFVVQALILLHGAVLLAFGRRTAHVVATLLQVTVVVGLAVVVQLLLVAPGSMVRDAIQARSDVSFLLPPVWFVALFQMLAGTRETIAFPLAFASVIATALATLAAGVLLGASHNRLTHMALETPVAHRTRLGMLVRRGIAFMARMVVPSPVARAIAGFTVRTVTRSRSHQTVLAMYLGIGAAGAMSVVVYWAVLVEFRMGQVPLVAWLSLPQVMLLSGLCGMRVLVAIPSFLRANWTFRLHAPDSKLASVIGGVRIAFLVCVVAPVGLATGVVVAIVWGVNFGVSHVLFTLTVGVVATDVLVIGLRKAPFTCSYYPGTSHSHTFWPLYAGAFGALVYGLATLEAFALVHRGVLAGVAAGGVALALLLAVIRRSHLRARPSLIFEEDAPGAGFAGFGLSEGVASGSPRVP